MIHQHPDGTFIQPIGPEAVQRTHGLIRPIRETRVTGRQTVANRQQRKHFPRSLTIHHGNRGRVLGRESRQRHPKEGQTCNLQHLIQCGQIDR